MKPAWTIGVASDAAEDSAGWAVLVLVLLCTSAVLVKVVGPGEAVVVLRGRRAVRLVLRGVLVAVPGLHRLHRVPLTDMLIDPLVVCAVTADGVPIRALSSAQVRLVDPLQYFSAAADSALDRGGFTNLAVAIEEGLTRDIARRALRELAHYPGSATADAVRAADRSLAPWGAVLTGLGDAVVEVTVDDTLMRWACMDTQRPVGQSTRD